MTEPPPAVLAPAAHEGAGATAESVAARNARLGRREWFSFREWLFWFGEFYLTPIAVLVLWLLVPLHDGDADAVAAADDGAAQAPLSLSFTRYLFGYRLWYSAWAAAFCFPFVFFHLTLQSRRWGWAFGLCWAVVFVAVDLSVLNALRPWLERSATYQIISSVSIMSAAFATMAPAVGSYYCLTRKSQSAKAHTQLHSQRHADEQDHEHGQEQVDALAHELQSPRPPPPHQQLLDSIQPIDPTAVQSPRPLQHFNFAAAAAAAADTAAAPTPNTAVVDGADAVPQIAPLPRATGPAAAAAESDVDAPTGVLPGATPHGRSAVPSRRFGPAGPMAPDQPSHAPVPAPAAMGHDSTSANGNGNTNGVQSPVSSAAPAPPMSPSAGVSVQVLSPAAIAALRVKMPASARDSMGVLPAALASPRVQRLRAAEKTRLRRAYVQPQCLCVAEASEQMRELPYIRTGLLNIGAASLVLACYFWSQFFTYLFLRYAVDSDNDGVAVGSNAAASRDAGSGNTGLQLLMSLGFNWSFIPFRWAVRLLDRIAYGAHGAALATASARAGLPPPQSRHRAVTHFCFLALELLYFLFWRGLFVGIQNTGTFALLYCAKVLNENAIRFVVPLTDWYHATLWRVSRMGWGCLRWVASSSTADERVTHVAEDVFNRAFAGMFSLFAFVAGLCVCHYGTNRHFYALLGADMRESQVRALLLLSAVALCVEFANYCLVEVLMKRWYGFSITGSVLPFFQAQHQVRAVIIGFLVHFCQDVYVAQLRFNL